MTTKRGWEEERGGEIIKMNKHQYSSYNGENELFTQRGSNNTLTFPHNIGSQHIQYLFICTTKYQAIRSGTY